MKKLGILLVLMLAGFISYGQTYRIKVTEGTFTIQATDDVLTSGVSFPSRYIGADKKANGKIYIYKKGIGVSNIPFEYPSVRGMAYTELVDGNNADAAFADADAVKTWFDTNTGFNTAGGAASSTVITPAQFSGTDREKIVAAISSAQDKGINKIVIDGVYTINRGIDIPSDFEIEINGEVKLKTPTVYALAENSGMITANLKTTFLGDYKRTDNRDYTLTDATGLSVGEIVTFFDDDFPKMSTGHSNRRGLVAVITAIDGNVVTIDRDFTNWLTSTTEGNNLFLTSKNARLVPTDFVFRMIDKDNIVISGRGVINGNRPADAGILNVPNDANVEPINDEWNEEDYTLGAGCVIAGLDNSTNITVKDVTIKKGFMHNIRYRYVDGFKFLNTVIDDAHDKNLLLHYSKNGLIDGNIVKNALFEDGIILYIYNKNIQITNNRIFGNPRYGLAVQKFNDNCVSSNNIIEFNGQNFYVATQSGFSSNNDVIVGGRMGTYRTTEKFALNIALLIEGHNISFNNLRMNYPYDRATGSYPEATGWQPIVIRSTSRNDLGISKQISFNGGGMVNMWARNRNISTQAWSGTAYNADKYLVTFGGSGSGVDYNIDGVSFNNFLFEGFGKGLKFSHTNETLEFSSLRFNQSTFKHSYQDELFDIGVLTADEDAVTFLNCDDYVSGYYIPGVIVNGQFETDTDWTKGTGNTINITDKRAEWNGTAGNVAMQQNDVLEIGKTYLVKYRVNIVSGSIRPRAGFSGQGANKSTPIGISYFTEEIVCSGSDDFSFLGVSFEGWVDDVSVVKID